MRRRVLAQRYRTRAGMSAQLGRDSRDLRGVQRFARRRRAQLALHLLTPSRSVLRDELTDRDCPGSHHRTGDEAGYTGTHAATVCIVHAAQRHESLLGAQRSSRATARDVPRRRSHRALGDHFSFIEASIALNRAEFASTVFFLPVSLK
jgi:hypothetical protein